MSHCGSVLTRGGGQLEGLSGWTREWGGGQHER